MMETIGHFAALALALGGMLLVLVSAIGLLRLPDVFMRCHAAGKAATVGVLATLAASASGIGGSGAWVRVLLAATFILITLPVATQLLLRAAIRRASSTDPAEARPFVETAVYALDPSQRRGKR